MSKRFAHEGLHRHLSGIQSGSAEIREPESSNRATEKINNGSLGQTADTEVSKASSTQTANDSATASSGASGAVDREHDRESQGKGKDTLQEELPNVSDLVKRLTSSSCKSQPTPPRPQFKQTVIEQTSVRSGETPEQNASPASAANQSDTNSATQAAVTQSTQSIDDSPMSGADIEGDAVPANVRRNRRALERRRRRKARERAALQALADKVPGQSINSMRALLAESELSKMPEKSSDKQASSWINDFLSTLKNAGPGGSPLKVTTSNTTAGQVTVNNNEGGKDTASAQLDSQETNKQDALSLLASAISSAVKVKGAKAATSTKQETKRRESPVEAERAPLPTSRKARMQAKAKAKVDRESKVSGKQDALVPKIRKAASSSGTVLADPAEGQAEGDTESPARRRRTTAAMDPDSVRLKPESLSFTALPIEQPPTPRLAHNLDRVLFNRGVYNLQDRYSGVYNFDPYLENIMPVEDFDFDALRTYKTSSEDSTLAEIAKSHSLRYVGSTSSMTSMLSHFHYLISQWRELNIDSLSRGFHVSDTKNSRNFTDIYKAPTAIFLRWKDGTYAIDADKEFSTPNVLMALGQSLEKLLTQTPSDFERYRKSDPRKVPDAERQAPESYHYSKQGDILMRSQLDAQDSRLPGSGVFDVKTRAVLPVRMSSRDHEGMTGYQILSEHGLYESYEREFYDMFRSTFLKYSLQVRMGRMEGIFIAYHNVEEIFGFQFMNLSDMDSVLHGQRDTCLGDQEFKASLEIVNKILTEATKEFPEKSIRLHFDTRSGVLPIMYIFAEPLEEHEIEAIQKPSSEAVADVERSLKGEPETSTEEPQNSSSAIESETEGSGQDSDIHSSLSTSSPSSSASLSPPNSATTTTRPLLAWTLTTSSTVNSKPVTRPENLSSSDTWELQYALKRIADPARAWAFYERTKTRRKKALTFDDEPNTSTPSSGEAAKSTEEEGEGKISGMSLREAMTSSPKDEGGKRRRGPNDGYIAMLRGLSQRGKVLREERLKQAEGRKKVVVGFEGHDSGLHIRKEQEASSTSSEEEVVDVDSYMAWLNKHQVGKGE
ncbi:mRNA degradation protein pet127-like protein [Elsinoe fawcettii]|nr:mRNA degradation protein pet127-like protein [Elsinoe fawcettii]